MKMRFCLFVFVLLFSGNVWSGWNGAGEIKQLFIYPTYAVVVQGPQGTGPNQTCTNNDAWSFSWSQFDAEVGRRIMASLLSAKITKSRIQVVIDGSSCGPENKKLFNGQIMFFE